MTAGLATRCAAALACCVFAARADEKPVQRVDVFSAAEQAKVVSQAEIEQALNKPKTRGIRLQATSTVTETKDAIDLNIPFELDSSELSSSARAQLEQLESALKSASLGEYRFQIAGHTDAKGGADYNRQLSMRRAETVKYFLEANGVAADRLESVGYGEDRLLTPGDPDNPVNRRVEIKNLGKR